MIRANDYNDYNDCNDLDAATARGHRIARRGPRLRVLLTAGALTTGLVLGAWAFTAAPAPDGPVCYGQGAAQTCER